MLSPITASLLKYLLVLTWLVVTFLVARLAEGQMKGNVMYRTEKKVESSYPSL